MLQTISPLDSRSVGIRSRLPPAETIPKSKVSGRTAVRRRVPAETRYLRKTNGKAAHEIQRCPWETKRNAMEKRISTPGESD